MAHKTKRWRLRLMERRILLVVGDFFIGIVALVLALATWAANADWLGVSRAFFLERVPGWFYLLPVAWIILLVELYDIHRAANLKVTVRGVLAALLVGVILYSFVYITSSPRSLPRLGVAIFLAVASVLTLAWRMLYIRIFTAPEFMRRVLVVGGGRAGKTILDVIYRLDTKPFYVVGVLDDDPDKKGTKIGEYMVLAGCDQLLDIIERENITDVVVAISGEMRGRTFQALLDAQELGVEITRMPVVYEELLSRVPICLLEADWILRSFVDESRVSEVYQLSKRLLDIFGGLVGVFILMLLLPFVGLAIIIESGRPIFYTQTRLGRGGQPYEIIKFRTMRRDAEPNGRPQWASEDDERATKVGRFLRKSHLDEFPQFINVLRGEMSLVGPRSERPELVEHFQQHVPFYRARLLVKPGITGWAQVNFNYAATIEETIVKLEYDLYYIKRRSLFVDIIVLLRTPATMLGLRGQ
jgi:exopolysaccharide biosynthesis polyprenyl glycosylphosphotransferase